MQPKIALLTLLLVPTALACAQPVDAPDCTQACVGPDAGNAADAIDADADAAVASPAEPGALISQYDFSGIEKIRDFENDAVGNTFVTGQGVVTATVNSSGTGAPNTGYLVKYSPDGAPLWHYVIEHPLGHEVIPRHIASGADGSVYVAGTAIHRRPSLPDLSSAFIHKLDAETGDRIWSRDSTLSGDVLGLVVGTDGRIYFYARMDRTSVANVGGTALSTGDHQDGMLAVYQANGNLVRARVLGNRANGFPSGNLIALEDGGCAMTAEIDLIPRFLEFDSMGTLRRSEEVPSYGDLTESNDGGFLIVGGYQTPLAWGTTPELQIDVRPAAALDEPSIFLGKWNANLSPQWLKGIGGTATLYARAPVQQNAQGDIYVLASAGRDGAVSMGGDTLPAFGGDDVAVGSYSELGKHRWSLTIGGEFIDYSSHFSLHNDEILVHALRTGSLSTELGTLVGGSLSAPRAQRWGFRQ